MAHATLLDLAGADAPASVTIRGKTLPVHGLPLGVIARVMRECPELARMLSQPGKVAIDVGEIIKSAPDQIGVLIAAGLGAYGDAAQERAANSLPVAEQIELLTKVIEETLPGGIGPFAARLKALAKAAGVDVAKLMASSTS